MNVKNALFLFLVFGMTSRAWGMRFDRDENSNFERPAILASIIEAIRANKTPQSQEWISQGQAQTIFKAAHAGTEQFRKYCAENKIDPNAQIKDAMPSSLVGHMIRRYFENSIDFDTLCVFFDQGARLSERYSVNVQYYFTQRLKSDFGDYESYVGYKAEHKTEQLPLSPVEDIICMAPSQLKIDHYHGEIMTRFRHATRKKQEELLQELAQRGVLITKLNTDLAVDTDRNLSSLLNDLLRAQQKDFSEKQNQLKTQAQEALKQLSSLTPNGALNTRYPAHTRKELYFKKEQDKELNTIDPSINGYFTYNPNEDKYSLIRNCHKADFSLARTLRAIGFGLTGACVLGGLFCFTKGRTWTKVSASIATVLTGVFTGGMWAEYNNFKKKYDSEEELLATVRTIDNSNTEKLNQFLIKQGEAIQGHLNTIKDAQQQYDKLSQQLSQLDPDHHQQPLLSDGDKKTIKNAQKFHEGTTDCL